MEGTSCYTWVVPEADSADLGVGELGFPCRVVLSQVSQIVTSQ